MAEGARSILSAWEEFRQGAEGYRELDGKRVLVLTHRSGRQDERSGIRADAVEGSGPVPCPRRQGDWEAAL
jgi:hypothetical protein